MDPSGAFVFRLPCSVVSARSKRSRGEGGQEHGDLLQLGRELQAEVQEMWENVFGVFTVAFEHLD